MSHPRILHYTKPILRKPQLLEEYVKGELTLFEFIVFDHIYCDNSVWDKDGIETLKGVINNSFILGIQAERVDLEFDILKEKLTALYEYITKVNQTEKVGYIVDSEGEFQVWDEDGEVLENFMDIEEAEQYIVDNGYNFLSKYENLPEPSEGCTYVGVDIDIETCQQEGFVICDFDEEDFDPTKEYRFYLFDLNANGGQSKTWLYTDISWESLLEEDWVDWGDIENCEGITRDETPETIYGLMNTLQTLCGYYGSNNFFSNY